jgi:uncharacterized protein (DUF2235 family)
MKRLIVCADGTWNFRDQIDDETQLRHATNVTKVARAVNPRSSKGIDQVVFYHDGVGTNKGLDHWVGGAIGEGIESNIRDLYRYIAYNYSEGDEIFLFGFSRGAFTVRTLAGFMKRFGLLIKADDFFVPDLFEAYKSQRFLDSVRADVKFRNLHEVKPCPKIKFIGVWDTVGALGLPGSIGAILNGPKFAFHDIGLDSHIQYAYQALAIDEQRVPFEPSFWARPSDWQGSLEQTWFAGVHCNCGGGYSPDGLANEALHWLVEKAERHGLEFNSEYLAHYRPCFNSELRDSMTPSYSALGRLVRQIGVHPNDGEQIHQSVLDRRAITELGYDPFNLTIAISGDHKIPIVDTTRIKRERCELAREFPNAIR